MVHGYGTCEVVGEGGGHVDVDVDARAARRVRRVRARWVRVGGAGNVVVGLECVRWGHSKHAGGRAFKCTGRAETCLPGPGFVSTVWDAYGVTTTRWLWA